MSIPAFIVQNRPNEDIYREIVDLDQQYDRNDWRYKLEGNCIGRFILTIFSCCLCFVPKTPQRQGWKERARWLHANRPAQDSQHYNLWQQAWDRVHRNRIRVYNPTTYSPNVVYHHRGPAVAVQPNYVRQVPAAPVYVQPVGRPIVNVQPNFVPQAVVQPRPVVQPVVGPTVNVHRSFVPQPVAPNRQFVQPVARPTVNVQPNFVPQTFTQHTMHQAHVPSPDLGRTVNARPINGPAAVQPKIPLTYVNADRVSPEARAFYQQRGNLLNPNNLPVAQAPGAPVVSANNRPTNFNPNQFIARNH